jgi:selenocysteine-specific elongation factor
LVDLTGIPLPVLQQILRQTTKAGNLIQVADNRHYLPETIMQLAEFTEKIATETAESDGFSVIQFRDASSIGRNLCIEILEYFDRVGFTRREGNSRFVRTEKENIFGK